MASLEQGALMLPTSLHQLIDRHRVDRCGLESEHEQTDDRSDRAQQHRQEAGCARVLTYDARGRTRRQRQKSETRRNFSGFLGRGEKIRTSDPLTPRPGERAQPSATARNDTHGRLAVQPVALGCSDGLPFPAAFSEGGTVTAVPAGDATALDLVWAAHDAILRGDLHAARRLLTALAAKLDGCAEGATAAK